MPVTLICANPACKKEFDVKPSQVTKKICCSTACFSVYRKMLTDEKYIGCKFGKLTISHRSESDSSKFVCICDCGSTCEVQPAKLTKGDTLSCGCHRRQVGQRTIQENRHAPQRTLHAGDKFGRWIVIQDLGVINGYSYSSCRCSCGTERKVMNSMLIKGHSQSCGCLLNELRPEIARKNFTKHGLSADPDYLRHIKHRRTNPLDQHWTVQMEQALRKMFPTCVVCGSLEMLATDHVKPITKGFGLLPGNAVVLCQPCNSTKYDKELDELPDDWRIRIEQAAKQFEDYWNRL